VVIPTAVWVFAGPAVAMVVLPVLVSSRLHGFAIVFGGVAAIVTLGAGVAVQRLAHRLDRSDTEGSVAGSLLGIGSIAVGMLLAALAAQTTNPLLALVAAAPLGGGYGLGLVSGLRETQRLAAPDELAGLTAVYYALTYVAFGLPLLLAWLHGYASYPTLLSATAGVVALCAVVVRINAPGATAQPGRLRSESAAEVR
jgi:hypothetical protein